MSGDETLLISLFIGCMVEVITLTTALIIKVKTTNETKYYYTITKVKPYTYRVHKCNDELLVQICVYEAESRKQCTEYLKKIREKENEKRNGRNKTKAK